MNKVLDIICEDFANLKEGMHLDVPFYDTQRNVLLRAEIALIKGDFPARSRLIGALGHTGKEVCAGWFCMYPTISLLPSVDSSRSLLPPVLGRKGGQRPVSAMRRARPAGPRRTSRRA